MHRGCIMHQSTEARAAMGVIDAAIMQHACSIMELAAHTPGFACATCRSRARMVTSKRVVAYSSNGTPLESTLY